MTPNFTYFRTCLFIVFTVAFSSAFSQSNTTKISDNTFYNLRATVQKNSIIINWNASDATAANYCEVQSSADGKTFSTIGLVMGADPKQTNNGFAFKQDVSKMKAGHAYYRILSIDANNKAYASNVIQAGK